MSYCKNRERGAAWVEIGILVALVAAVCIPALFDLGEKTANVYCKARGGFDDNGSLQFGYEYYNPNRMEDGDPCIDWSDGVGSSSTESTSSQGSSSSGQSSSQDSSSSSSSRPEGGEGS